MKLVKLIYRNLMGNGLKTWLSVFVLSISFVLIIFMQGLLEGWNRQAINDMTQWEIADGQYWNNNYDPYDPFTLDSSSAPLPGALQNQDNKGQIEPVLIVPGTMYTSGRSTAIMMKGIRPQQKLLLLPTNLLLSDDSTEINAIIGSGMAEQTGLKKDDMVTLRWRDAHGTFEAQDIRIAAIFKTFVPSVDGGQVWLSLDALQRMTMKFGEMTIIIKSPQADKKQHIAGWDFKDAARLTKPLRDTLRSKVIGQSVFYIIFLMLALLTIFDTQTLAIFRRQKEIGTLVALGMTQKQVLGLFTLEGTTNALLAIVLGALYGIPLFVYFAINGIQMPSGSSEFGIALADKIYPTFSLPLITATSIFIILITALVSYLPARKIATMKPTDAIRGKIQ